MAQHPALRGRSPPCAGRFCPRPGLASQVFEETERLARSREIHSFKVDTDNDNQIMKHLLERNGFQFCGTICFDNSEKIAFEKLI